VRWVKAMVLAVALSACSLVATRGPEPGPLTHREIWWENHTHDTYEMRSTEGGNFSGASLVEPCGAGGIGRPMEDVFAFELAAPGDPTSAAGTPVTDWRAWQAAARDRHVVAVIGPGGHVEVDLRPEPPSTHDKFCP